MKKEGLITEKYLDKRLSEHAKAIVEAVDDVLQRRLEKIEEKLSKDINNVQTLIDGYVKAQEDFREEFKIMKHKMSKVEKVIKEKLGIEI